MKRKKAEKYEAGYSKENLLKKCAAGALGLVMLGSVAGCRGGASLEGDVPYTDPDAAAPRVSDSDSAKDDASQQEVQRNETQEG